MSSNVAAELKGIDDSTTRQNVSLLEKEGQVMEVGQEVS